MATDAVVRARINSKIKDKAADVLAEMGLSVSDAIRMMLVRVAAEKALPFDVRTPNALTAKTLQKGRRRQDLVSARDAEDLYKQLGL